jgi:hypothetical protein
MFTYPRENQVQDTGGLVRRTGRERPRSVWYRVRQAISEMNYSTRRLVELQAPWICDGSAESGAHTRRTPATTPGPVRITPSAATARTA